MNFEPTYQVLSDLREQLNNNNVPHIIVYDNGGKTADRYTVFIREELAKGTYDVYIMSDEPLSPQGVNQYSHSVDQALHDHLGVRVELDRVPFIVIMAIVQRLSYSV